MTDLSFGVWPPAIDISTAANQQIFNPQFGVANTSRTDTTTLNRATLSVPVTTTGTNLALNTDMVPSAITPGWTFTTGTPQSGTPPGYVVFSLSADDGVGNIPAGGSVAFSLTGVKVNTAAGTAVLQFHAGSWNPSCEIALTTPSTTPAITRYSITPADPQTVTTLQGQSVVLSWTTSGAAYCTIEDDQGDKWENLPTSGTLADTPTQGNTQIQSTPELGRYYNRTFTLTAYAAGAVDSDQRSVPTTIQLPTILGFSVTPASLALGQQATVTWSVMNIDPGLGTITLTIDPADGTGTYTAAIPPTPASGSSVVTPTPQTTTTYTLAADNGYGVAAPQLAQQVTGPLPAGWQEMTGLETLSANANGMSPVSPAGLVAFAGFLYYWTSNPNGFYRTSDGTSWTAIPPAPAPLPPLDGIVVTDLGDGEKLWAFGGAPLVAAFLASSSDGIYWYTRPTPTYPARSFGKYVVGDGTIVVLGGRDGNQSSMTDVWSTSDLCWTQVGNSFPEIPSNISGHAVARFAGKLQTAVMNTQWARLLYSSSDGGETWSSTAISQPVILVPPCLLPVGNVLLLFGTGDLGSGAGNFTLVMDSTGSWSAPANLSYMVGGVVWSAAIYKGCLWLAVGGQSPNLKFFVVNQILPGTTFTLTPPTNSAS